MWVTRQALPDDAGYFVVPRRYAISVGWALLCLVAMGAFQIALFWARVANLEAMDVRILAERTERRTLVDRRMDMLMSDRDRILRLEEQMRHQTEILVRIERKLDGGR